MECTGYNTNLHALCQFLEKSIIKPPGSPEKHAELLAAKGRNWSRAVANTAWAMDSRWTTVGTKHGGHPHVKHAPFVYSVLAQREAAALFAAELDGTLRHPFRAGDDVMMPLLHHGLLRAGGAERYGLPVTVHPPDEAAATFVLLSCLDGLVCRKSRSAELERDVEVNPLVSGTWRVGAAERLKISVCGPILVPVRIVSLLGCSLLAVLFCTLALLGFKDNCKQVRTMRESAIWLVQCQFRRPG